MSGLNWILRHQEGQFFERKSCYDRSRGKAGPRPMRDVARDVAEMVAAIANADGGVVPVHFTCARVLVDSRLTGGCLGPVFFATSASLKLDVPGIHGTCQDKTNRPGARPHAAQCSLALLPGGDQRAGSPPLFLFRSHTSSDVAQGRLPRDTAESGELFLLVASLQSVVALAQSRARITFQGKLCCPSLPRRQRQLSTPQSP